MRRRRHSPVSASSAESQGTSRSRGARTRSNVIWQCSTCGSPADPLYGRGDDSWCPSCGASGTICGEEGKFPFPEKHGQWLRRQRNRVGQTHADREIDEFLARPFARRQTGAMKRAKMHSGAYFCAECLIEFELFAEESLKCDRCRGPLTQGSLADALPDSEDGDDESAD
jgi:DNA-directed RNA polymerase subunit RPC12/RpoP